MKKLDKLLDEQRQSDVKIKAFNELLDDLASTKDKRKSLWREVYENAVSDRERASILYTEAFKAMTGGVGDHATLGSVMTKYLERMCKSNAQILSLAELISKAEQVEERLNSDDLFSKISAE
jgi:hypothetical protein